MLQEKLYPGWARPIRNWWKKGWNRIILFWFVVFITSFAVIFVIATDYIQWDKLNRDFMPTNELSRAFLASFILVMDLLIVMQVRNYSYNMRIVLTVLEQACNILDVSLAFKSLAFCH